MPAEKASDMMPAVLMTWSEGLGEGRSGSIVVRSGEAGREGNGDACGYGECCRGAIVNRNMRASICQKERRLTKVSAHPVGNRTSVSVPTQESSLAINPIRSSFCNVFFDLKIPSLLILMRHSSLGLPLSGVNADASVKIWGFGGSLWKYQHSVAQSIMAMWRVGEALFLKSVLAGCDMDDMKSESLWTVGRVKRWATICFWGGSSWSFARWLREILLFLRSGSVSTSSSVWRTTVQPGGIAE